MTYTETCDAMAELGRKKGLSVTRTPLAYLMGCVLAGAYIGVALILALTCTAGLPAGVRPLVSGSVFGLGLLLVIFAGAELFTGGVMYATFGLAKRRATVVQVVAMLVAMWIGNLIGSIVVAWVFAEGGGGAVFSTADFLSAYAAKKTSADPLALVCRSALCNWLVCLAIWMPARIQNEAAKIWAMAWCLLAFVACGFEHSVANMTAFSLALFDPKPAVTLAAAAYNLSWVTLGNGVGGGVFVALSYLLYARTEAQPTQPDKAVSP